MVIDSSIPLALNTDDGILIMATLSELVDAVAEAEGMDSASVALIARYAREAGVLWKKGTGPCAARMRVAGPGDHLVTGKRSSLATGLPGLVHPFRGLIAA